MPLWAVVPVKPFGQAKSRLAPVLPDEARDRLSRQLLAHALAVLAQAPAVAQTLVVSRDPAALSLARLSGAQVLAEAAPPSAEGPPAAGGEEAALNAALTQATAAAQAAGAGAVLILPADLPALNAGDLAALLALDGPAPRVVIAPDRHEAGTNALLVRPPGLLRYAFGEGSFQRHMAQAELAGAAVRVCRLPGVALDVDWPEDWRLFQQAAPGD